MWCNEGRGTLAAVAGAVASMVATTTVQAQGTADYDRQRPAQRARGQPPPGYGQPPPGYGPQSPQPYGQRRPYTQRAPRRQPQRVRIPYEKGMRVPPGGRVYSRGRPGMWISGISVLGAFYISTAFTASLIDDIDSDPDDDDEINLLYVPVIGPFLFAPHASEVGRPFVIFDGVAQTAGATLIILGATLRRKFLEYYADVAGSRRVAVGPMLGPHTLGVSIGIF